MSRPQLSEGGDDDESPAPTPNRGKKLDLDEKPPAPADTGCKCWSGCFAGCIYIAFIELVILRFWAVWLLFDFSLDIWCMNTIPLQISQYPRNTGCTSPPVVLIVKPITFSSVNFTPPNKNRLKTTDKMFLICPHTVVVSGELTVVHRNIE